MGDAIGAATDGMADGGTAAPVMGTDGGDANGAHIRQRPQDAGFQGLLNLRGGGVLRPFAQESAYKRERAPTTERAITRSNTTTAAFSPVSPRRRRPGDELRPLHCRRRPEPRPRRLRGLSSRGGLGWNVLVTLHVANFTLTTYGVSLWRHQGPTNTGGDSGV